MSGSNGDTSSTFGWREGSLDDRARQLERALGVTLEPRDSLYRGEYYNWRGEDDAHVTLQANFIEDDDGLPTDDLHPDHVVLLHASALPEHMTRAVAALEGIERLADE